MKCAIYELEKKLLIVIRCYTAINDTDDNHDYDNQKNRNSVMRNHVEGLVSLELERLIE